MQVIVKGRHTHVPNSLKELATHKLEKLERFLDKIQSLEIEFSEEHNPRIADKHKVEVTLVTKQHVLRAHASGPDPASAVDIVLNKIEAQVKRLKGKIVQRRTGHGARGSAAGLNGQPSRNGGRARLESDDDEGADPRRITSVKRFTVKPMTPEEAVLQLESLGHDFYLFVNAESEQAGVVYRKKDGSFGLIEPE